MLNILCAFDNEYAMDNHECTELIIFAEYGQMTCNHSLNIVEYSKNC